MATYKIIYRDELSDRNPVREEAFVEAADYDSALKQARRIVQHAGVLISVGLANPEETELRTSSDPETSL